MDPGIEAFLAKTDALIAKHGHTCVQILGETFDDTFTYSVGLTEMGWPELICMSLGPQTATTIVNEVVSRLRTLEKMPEDGMVVTEALTVPVQLRSVPDERIQTFFKVALTRANRRGLPDTAVKGIQIVWPDESGRFPTDAGYDHRRFPQRLLRSDGENIVSLGSKRRPH